MDKEIFDGDRENLQNVGSEGAIVSSESRSHLPVRFSPTDASTSLSVGRLFTELESVPHSEVPELSRRIIISFHLELAERALAIPQERSKAERLIGLRLASSALDGFLGDRPFGGRTNETLDQALLGVRRAQLEIMGRRLAWSEDEKVLYPWTDLVRNPGQDAARRSWEACNEIIHYKGQASAAPNISQLMRAAAIYAEAAIVQIESLRYTEGITGIKYDEQTLEGINELKSQIDSLSSDNYNFSSYLEELDTRVRAAVVRFVRRTVFSKKVWLALLDHARIVFAPERSQDGKAPMGLDDEQARAVRKEYAAILETMTTHPDSYDIEPSRLPEIKTELVGQKALLTDNLSIGQ